MAQIHTLTESLCNTTRMYGWEQKGTVNEPLGLAMAIHLVKALVTKTPANTSSRGDPVVDNLKLHKIITSNFWIEFGGEYGRKGVSTKSKEHTLRELKEIGEIVLVFKEGYTPEQNRKKYIKFKSKLKGYNGFKLCFACRGRAEVRHHIIWIRNGGRNHKKNIVALCRPCHAEIHPWLRERAKQIIIKHKS